MIDQHFPSVTAFPEFPAAGDAQLHGGERVLWRGQAGIAEYAFDQHASLPRWTLPETTALIVTDQRILYAHTGSDPLDGGAPASGELRWLWPQHVRVQPGAREAGRAAAVTQIQLVCGGSDGSWPALVFAGGDLQNVRDADRLGNVIRQSIARFRVDNAGPLGLTTAQSRMLSRLLIGPEFNNYQGGPGQTVSIQGALPVTRSAPAAPDHPTEPAPDYPPLDFPAPAFAAPANPPAAYPAPANTPAAYPAPANTPAAYPMPANPPAAYPAPANTPAAYPTPANPPTAYPTPANTPAAYPTPANPPAAYPTPAYSSAAYSADGYSPPAYPPLDRPSPPVAGDGLSRPAPVPVSAAHRAPDQPMDPWAGPRATPRPAAEPPANWPPSEAATPATAYESLPFTQPPTTWPLPEPATPATGYEPPPFAEPATLATGPEFEPETPFIGYEPPSFSEPSWSHGSLPSGQQADDARTADPTSPDPWSDDSWSPDSWSADPTHADPMTTDPMHAGPMTTGPMTADDWPLPATAEETRLISVRPGMAADMARALQAANAEAATQQAEPDLASRAASLAARVASLVSQSAGLDDDANPAGSGHRYEPLASHLGPPLVEDVEHLETTADLTERAAVLRRMEARFAANSAGNKAAARRVDRDPGGARSNRNT